MTEKPILKPGPDHPITVEPTPGRVVVTAAGRKIADTTAALTLREADYPPAQYIPLADVDPAMLERTDHASYCPYKGDASYYSVLTDEGTLENAVWEYRTPYESVAEIEGHVAFYRDKVEITTT
ncbi:MAG TPA: DUF427 domain-containing protein [Solirubrobacteraceae bacterium]